MARGLLKRFAGVCIAVGLLAVGGSADAAVDPLPPGPKPPAPARVVAPPGPDAPIKRFAPPAWGYRIDLPVDWVVETPAPYTVVMSGPEGSDAYFTPVAIQNVKAPLPDDPEGSARRVLAEHLAGLRAAHPTLRVMRETAFRPPDGAADGGRADLPQGLQLVVDWRGEGGLVRHWAVVRPRPRAAVVHLWTFSAEQPLFEAWVLVARAILDSWTLSRPPEGG